MRPVANLYIAQIVILIAVPVTAAGQVPVATISGSVTDPAGVLDVQLPGLSGLDLQRELVQSGRQIPIIFIMAHGDIPLTVRAMKAGAVEFLTKPFREQELLDATMQALEQDRAARARRAENAHLRERYDQLTPREREVMGLIVAGMLNKQIAAELGASEATIKIHRAHVMQKMEAQSVADLVRMAEKLELALPEA
jgi:FixJ family two-component response regulator